MYMYCLECRDLGTFDGVFKKYLYLIYIFHISICTCTYLFLVQIYIHMYMNVMYIICVQGLILFSTCMLNLQSYVHAHSVYIVYICMWSTCTCAPHAHITTAAPDNTANCTVTEIFDNHHRRHYPNPIGTRFQNCTVFLSSTHGSPHPHYNSTILSECNTF